MTIKNTKRTNVITFEAVDKFYDQFHALKNINLTIQEGEKVVICGPSGSGKSTLIRCINALESIQNGQLSLFDEVLSPKHLDKGKIGMVFQHFNLFPHLTVLENLTLSPIKTLKL